MTSHYHVQLIADVIHKKGVRHVVFSPGSRSAPFVIAFQEYEAINKYVIPDERVAGYFALGIAQQLQRPVVVVCTSGTAVLNLAPAVCEAYYQKIPLLVLTADRPEELLDKGENQTINQAEIFENFTTGFYNFSPLNTLAAKRDFFVKLDIAYNCMMEFEPAPVHWNVHIPEPLYDRAGEELGHYELTPYNEKPDYFTGHLVGLPKLWESNTRIILIVGLLPDDFGIRLLLSEINRAQNVVILHEHASNLRMYEEIHCNCDAMFAAIKEEDAALYSAGIVVTMGGQVLSKRLKQFFKKNKPKEHWHVSFNNDEWDTFGCLTHAVPMRIPEFLEMLPIAKTADPIFKRRWEALKQQCVEKTNAFVDNIPFSDFKAYEEIYRQIPKHINLQLGNSTPVRYAQYFPLSAFTTVNSNRGTSGIDGCVSTAAGAAVVNKSLTVCIVGDVSFFYDSNALWNNHLSPDLRIIVINNGGGNIFRMVEGATSVKNFQTFFETAHQLTAKHLASMYQLPYYICTAIDELQHALPDFFAKSEKAKILEVKTNNEVSAAVYKQYFEFIKQN